MNKWMRFLEKHIFATYIKSYGFHPNWNDGTMEAWNYGSKENEN